jgi:predicted enzyme related to lactoylglutathione lyase
VPAPCYFEIHADDCARAQKFYGDVFGWSFTSFPSTDLDAMVETAIAAGAKSVMAKFPIKGLGWTAYLIDTEMNMFGLFQKDENA